MWQPDRATNTPALLQLQQYNNNNNNKEITLYSAQIITSYWMKDMRDIYPIFVTNNESK